MQTPLKNAPSRGGSVLHLIYMVYWAHCPPDSAPNRISIGLAVVASAGLTNVTNRHTDRALYSVCSNRPLSLAIAAMRPNNYCARESGGAVL